MRLYFTTLLIILSSIAVTGQSFFEIIEESNLIGKTNVQRDLNPDKYISAHLDIDGLRDFLLKKAPSENDFRNKNKSLLINLPSANGEMLTYEVYETMMMESGLAEKYPEIKTYKGYNTKNKKERIHLGLGYNGFYASVSKGKDSYAIDRYNRHNQKVYMSYYLRDHHEERGSSDICGTTGTELLENEMHSFFRNTGENLPLRQYRMAIATTGEFGSFYGPEKEDVLSELVKSVNRMNQILENDFAIRLVLVDNMDQVIFTDPNTDPYSDGNTGGTLLGQNTNVLNSNLGFSNYDIGHVYTRGCDDVGGVAFIRSLCAGNKGGGVTCHYSNDITAMAVRVAAHEVGHQLGSNHTFNNCSGNENSGTAYEPGSGSTIMSYGGLCGSSLNVTSTADDYFHVSSIIEITNYSRNGLGNNCAELIETNNHIPEVTIPISGGFNIPISTPFELTGEATDEDGDDLTYTWEQFNLGPSSLLGAPQANSPLFRSVYPSTSPTRVFPQIATIITNGQDNTEVLPNYSRDLSFQFIVRDNNPESGGVAWTDISFKSDDSAGPFLVNYPNGGDEFTVGEEVEITWDVAGTDNEIINCKAVDIYLSTDRGVTYDYLLLASTTNDGSAKVFMPNAVGNKVRIKIKASESIFFDISDQDFTIVEPTEPTFIFSYSPTFIESCIPNDVQINIETAGFLDYDKPIDFSIEGDLPEGLDIAFENAQLLPGELTTANVTLAEGIAGGVYEMTIKAVSENDTLYRSVLLDLVSSDFSDIVGLSPELGSSGNVVSPIFSWKPDADVKEYRFRLSDNPSFLEEKSDILYDVILQDSFFELDDILAKSTIYYWTVVGMNECGDSAPGEIYTFGTEALSCAVYDYNDVPAPISQSGVITLEMPLEINSSGQVTDVNIRKLRGPHQWVSELKGELISPAGTKVILFNGKCPGQSDFNLGFDDDATTEVTCPLNQGIFYKPQEKLDTFRGEEIAGEWIFVMSDKAIGNGGSVQEYKLELCSNEVLASPFIVNNEPMPLPSGVGRRLSNEFLLSEDDNNTSDELLYTIVRLPSNGLLRLENDTIEVGDQFTQEDLDNKSVRYLHDGNSEDDLFIFTVEDGEGGWIDLTIFNIVIDNDVTLDVEDLSIDTYTLAPNPSKGQFLISFDELQKEARFEMFDVVGRRIPLNINGRGAEFNIEMNTRQAGVYFLVITADNRKAVEKIVVKQ